MASHAQIEANRRNSQKSTGPRTGAGKEISSRNAVNTGLYAHSLLIEGEDPDELTALAHDYEDSFHPEGPAEAALVHQLLAADWFFRRMRAVETQLWNDQIAHTRNYNDAGFHQGLALSSAYRYLDAHLTAIQRRASALERAFHRALADLHRLQSRRPADGEAFEILNPQPPIPNPRCEAPIGFVPPCPPTARFSPTLRHLPHPQPLQNPATCCKTPQNQPANPSKISRSFGIIRAYLSPYSTRKGSLS